MALELGGRRLRPAAAIRLTAAVGLAVVVRRRREIEVVVGVGSGERTAERAAWMR